MKANTQKVEQSAQSLNRAVNGQSVQNDMIVIKEFSNRGIDATPRVDVFTYNIWKFQKGRQVKKGEKSVKVRTFIEDEKTGKTRCSIACLFHISQTDPVEAGAWDRQDPATAWDADKFTEIQPGISIMAT